MFSNFIKITLRNLLKYKAYSFINIAGLAIGIACCILILLFVRDELSYDKFQRNYDHIYRAYLDARIGNNEHFAAVTPEPMAEALVRDFPQVKAAVKLNGFGNPVLRYQDKVFSEARYFWTDSTIFDVFTIEFIKGDAQNALNQPNTLVITEQTAEKYFGDDDPLGKVINYDNRIDLLVTGVVKAFPANAHFHFDFLGSLVGQTGSEQFWFRNNYYTYFVLRDGVDPKAFESLMNDKFIEYSSPEIEAATGLSMAENIEQGFRYRFSLQPLADIHLKSHLEFEIEPNSDIAYVYSFAVIAVGILLIAMINFMNLTTAKSAGRAKEVGIRKTLGSSFNQLIRQFLAESVVISFLAVALAVGLVYLLLPLFNEIAQKEFTAGFLANPGVIFSLILLSVLIGILAGSYPAFFLASFKPVAVLSGKFKLGARGAFLRSGLVVFQFALSIILIAGTLIVYSQLQYIQSKNLGYNKAQVLILHKTDHLGAGLAGFMDELKANPDIIHASNSGHVIGSSFGSYTFRMKDQPEQAPILLWLTFTDVDFANTYQFKFKEGRYYSTDRATDSTAIVVNEAALKVFGIKGDPVGQEVVFVGGDYNDRAVRIIGVIEDFHFESFHSKIKPVALKLWGAGDFGSYVSVRIAADQMPETIEYIREKWLRYAGQQAFEYTFLDEDFTKIHAAEQRTGKLFTTFSILAILVACLGLFGLAAYTAAQRTKEIGIRKVLGASVTSILILLSKEFTKWVIISNLIAWPAAYFLMNQWLQDFHYRIDIGIWVFITAGVVSLAVAIITVSSQAIKAAVRNPVKSIGYE